MRSTLLLGGTLHGPPGWPSAPPAHPASPAPAAPARTRRRLSSHLRIRSSVIPSPFLALWAVTANPITPSTSDVDSMQQKAGHPRHEGELVFTVPNRQGPKERYMPSFAS